jgi:hypothetical protein
MDNQTSEDWAVIVEALKYSKRAKAEYGGYPRASSPNADAKRNTSRWPAVVEALTATQLVRATAPVMAIGICRRG